MSITLSLNDKARELFAKSNFTYNDIFDNRDLLKECVQKRLDIHSIDHQEIQMIINNKKEKWWFKKGTRDIECYELRVDSNYFDNRECLTLNRDGFIGFCGWADDINRVPIIEGFIEFLYLLDQRKNR